LPQPAIVDSQGFAALAKAILTNSLQNLCAFQSTPRAESISVKQIAKQFARPRAGFARAILAPAQTAVRQSWIWFFTEPFPAPSRIRRGDPECKTQ
jgi:hypothetical protein